MRRILLNICICIAAFSFYSCDEEFGPIITFEEVQKGAYPRLVDASSAEFDLENQGETSYSYEVEFVTENEGANVASYDLFASFIPGNGTDTIPPTLFRSFSQGDFVTNEQGFRAARVSIPLSELSSALGLQPGNYQANDRFEFESSLTLDNGAIFSSENSSATVNGPALGTYFEFSTVVTCPIDLNKFVGEYFFDYNGPAPDVSGSTPFGENLDPIVLSSVLGASSTTRQFEVVYRPELNIGQPAMRIQFDLACDGTTARVENVTGLGCGGGLITIGPGFPEAFNRDDDSSFIVNFVDFENDGGCGIPGLDFSVIFTKL